MEEIKQTGVASVTSFSVSKQVVTLKIKFSYEELLTSINMLRAFNTDVTIFAKEPLGKGLNLGVFTIGGTTFDRDRNCVVTFKSLIDSVDPDNICQIMKQESVKIRFLAVVEQNEEDMEEEE